MTRKVSAEKPKRREPRLGKLRPNQQAEWYNGECTDVRVRQTDGPRVNSWLCQFTSQNDSEKVVYIISSSLKGARSYRVVLAREIVHNESSTMPGIE